MEVIDEYVSILISKNTHTRLKMIDEYIYRMTDTLDGEIAEMLHYLDMTTDGENVLALNNDLNGFEVLSIEEFIEKHSKKEADLNAERK